MGELPLIGEDSLISLPTMVFWMATFSLNFLRGSFLSIFSSSAGVYWSKNSSMDRYPPPTRTNKDKPTLLTVDLVLVNPDRHSLGAELIDALALPEEHDLELLPVGVVVDELSQALVNGVVLHGDVHRDPLLQLDYVVLQSFNFDFGVL